MDPRKLEVVAHRHGQKEFYEDDDPEPATEEFLNALVAIFQWGVPDNKVTAAGIAARALTVARALNISESRAESMRAQAGRLGLSREWLSNLLDEFSQQWGMTVPSGKSRASREIFRRSRNVFVRGKQGLVQSELF